MQAPPPAGCTGKAPPPPSPPVAPPGDGVGATLDEALVVLLSSVPAPPTPPTAKTSAAAPLHTATAVLPLRFITTLDCKSST